MPVIATKPVISQALQILDVCGMNPLNSNWGAKVKATVTILIIAAFSVEVLATFVTTRSDLKSLNTLAFTLGSWQTLVKLLMLIIKRKEIVSLLGIMDELYQTTNRCNLSSDLGRRIQNTYSSYNRVVKSLAVIGISCTLLFFVSSVLYGMLPMPMYHIGELVKWPTFEIVLAFEVSVVISAAIAYSGTEYLYFAVILYVYSEFEIIKERISSLPEVEEKFLRQELGFIVDQHNIVLRCCKQQNGIFSMVLLVYFVLSMFILSSGLVTVFIWCFSNPLNLLRILPLLLLASGQLFFYCLGGTILTTANKGVANVVLQSNWLLIEDFRLKKCLLLVIQRSQKAEGFRAGKLIDVNLETFAVALKTALSFFAAFQAIYNTGEN